MSVVDFAVHIRMVSEQMYPKVLNMPSMPSNPPNKPTLSYGLKCLHVQASLTIVYLPLNSFNLRNRLMAPKVVKF